MALSDLEVYSEYAYETRTEVLDQQIALFNQAAAGTITLQGAAHQGDFSDEILFAKISGGTVKRRNAYSQASISQKKLTQLVDTSIKIAAGTFEIELNPSQWKWIQMNPETAGAAMGRQLAVDTMADMLNTAISATVAAYRGQAEIVNDVSGATAPADEPSFQNLIGTAGKLGDRQNSLNAWVMHSNTMTKLYLQQFNNAERLFKFGDIMVMRDPFGRLLIQTDAPGLVGTATDAGKYFTLGLQPGAIYVGANNDFTDNWETKNGQENIQRTYQAEWSYNLGIDGFSWDKENGGKSPTDAALFVSTNWDRYATSHKDLGGVLMISK